MVKLIDALDARDKEKRKYDLIVINENVNSSIVFQDIVYVCEAFGYDYVSSRLPDDDILAMVLYESEYLRTVPRYIAKEE